MWLLGGGGGAFSQDGELRSRERGWSRRGRIQKAFSGARRGADNAHGAEKLAAVEVYGLWRNVGVSQTRGLTDQHLVPRDLLERFSFLTITILRAFTYFGCWNFDGRPCRFLRSGTGRFLALVHGSRPSRKSYRRDCYFIGTHCGALAVESP